MRDSDAEALGQVLADQANGTVVNRLLYQLDRKVNGGGDRDPHGLIGALTRLHRYSPLEQRSPRDDDALVRLHAALTDLRRAISDAREES